MIRWMVVALLLVYGVADAGMSAPRRWVVAAGGPTYIVNDTFTDTNDTELSLHTGEVGATWIKAEDKPGNSKISGNELLQGYSEGTSLYMASGTPSSADYTVEVDVKKYRTDAGDNYVSIWGRWSSADVNTGYFVDYIESSAEWKMYSRSGGTTTQIGSTYSHSMTVNTYYNAKLVFSGTSIVFKIDDTTVISATDSSVSQVGKGGVGLANGGNVGDFKLDNFKVY